MTHEALKLALEALRMADELFDERGIDFKEYGLEFDKDIRVKYRDTITAIKEALEQTQEPVAWRAPKWSNLHGEYGYRDFDDPVTDINGKPSPYNEPLYTSPPQRTWVGLTDEDISEIVRGTHNTGSFVRAIESKLKEKNI